MPNEIQYAEHVHRIPYRTIRKPGNFDDMLVWLLFAFEVVAVAFFFSLFHLTILVFLLSNKDNIDIGNMLKLNFSGCTYNMVF